MLNEKHNCPNSDYNKKQGQNNSSQSTKSVSSASNDNVGIKSALEHIADRLDNIVSWQKGIEEWQKGMTESQAKMVGFYADLVQVTRALRGSTVDPKEEELAQQEERYDQDKEDGLV